MSGRRVHQQSRQIPSIFKMTQKVGKQYWTEENMLGSICLSVSVIQFYSLTYDAGTQTHCSSKRRSCLGWRQTPRGTWSAKILLHYFIQSWIVSFRAEALWFFLKYTIIWSSTWPSVFLSSIYIYTTFSALVSSFLGAPVNNIQLEGHIRLTIPSCTSPNVTIKSSECPHIVS